jgi:tetratricopeptide (TPR) repeat protein
MHYSGGCLRLNRYLVAVLLVGILASSQLARAESDFETAEILFTQAVLAYDDGNYGDATRTLLKAHALDPGNVNVTYYLGLAYNAQGDFAEAERYLRQGVQAQPKNLDMRYQLGIALYGQKRYDDALKEFLTVLAADPQKDHVGYYTGLCYYQKRDFENAITYFRRNVSTDSKTHQLNQYYLGLALREMGRNAEAVEELTEAIRIEPASPLVAGTQQLLTAVREESGGKRLRLEATFNGQYDSNPGQERQPRASGGNLINVKADSRLFRSGPWESHVTYTFLQTLNYGFHRFDLTDNFLAGDLSYRTLFFGLPAIAAAQLSNDLLLLGGKIFLERPTTTFTFTLQENPLNFTTVIVRPQYKDFRLHDDSRVRDAVNHLVGVVHYIGFGRGNRLGFGYHFDNEDAVSHDWSYTGHKAISSLLLVLPWGLEGTVNFEHHTRFYGSQGIIPGHRTDNETTAFAALSKDLTPNLRATLQYLWDRNASTTSDFSYVRQVSALGLTWRY